MKIAIGINSFKDEKNLSKREQLCLESLRKCKNKNPNVTLYNVISDEDDINFSDFKTLKIPQKGKYPFVNDLLNCLSKTDNDLIVFINNDIILNNTFFKQLEDDIETYPASRGHLHELNSLDEELKVQSYSVHGFDLFAFKRDWWVENSHKFPFLYLGKPYWDTVFFITSVVNSKYKILNKQPPVIFHIEHDSVSCKDTDEYEQHNTNIAQTVPEMSRWWNFVQNVLLKRETVNDILWWKPFKNELQLERQILNNEN
tara:strand:+ start:3224 stop:3994 length:771 start_codon:yes stop_codon:yes gene_type:complete